MFLLCVFDLDVDMFLLCVCDLDVDMFLLCACDLDVDMFLLCACDLDVDTIWSTGSTCYFERHCSITSLGNIYSVISSMWYYEIRNCITNYNE